MRRAKSSSNSTEAPSYKRLSRNAKTMYVKKPKELSHLSDEEYIRRVQEKMRTDKVPAKEAAERVIDDAYRNHEIQKNDFISRLLRKLPPGGWEYDEGAAVAEHRREERKESEKYKKLIKVATVTKNIITFALGLIKTLGISAYNTFTYYTPDDLTYNQTVLEKPPDPTFEKVPPNEIKAQPPFFGRVISNRLSLKEPFYNLVQDAFYKTSDAYLETDIHALRDVPGIPTSVEDFTDEDRREAEKFLSPQYLLKRLEKKRELEEAGLCIPIVNKDTTRIEGFVEGDISTKTVWIAWKGTDFSNQFTSYLSSDSDAWADIGASAPVAVRQITKRDNILKARSTVIEELPVTISFNKGFWDRFEKCYESLKNGISTVLMNMQLYRLTEGPEDHNYGFIENIYNFIITGHSLGGALSEICGVVLKSLHPKWNITVITFAPAKGLLDTKILTQYKAFADLEDNSYRFTTLKDAINTLPPWGEHLGSMNIRLPGESNPGSHARDKILEKLDQSDPTSEDSGFLTMLAARGKLSKSKSRTK